MMVDFWAWFDALGTHFEKAFTLGLLPVALAGLLCWILLIPLAGRLAFPAHGKAITTSFACLGAMLGVFIGASREPVVGAALPSLVTLIAGLLVYVFGKNEQVEWRAIIPIALIALVLSASAGGFYGGAARNIQEGNDANQSFAKEINKGYLMRRLSMIDTLKDMCIKGCLNKENSSPDHCTKQCLMSVLHDLELFSRSAKSVVDSTSERPKDESN